MNKSQFMQAAGITSALADKWFDVVTQTMQQFDISTPLRQAHFIGQVGTESNGFRSVSESLNYSVDALKIFGSRLTVDQRQRLGRKPGEKALPPARQAEIANIVYGGRYGNTQPGDGWKYRGRGLKQITFRDNYRGCGNTLGIDLITDPDLLLTDKYAALSAGWFWKSNNCNQFADADDISGLTKRINGGLNGLGDRINRTRKAKAVLL